MRNAGFHELEEDFFRRGEELGEAAVEPYEDFADLDADTRIIAERRRPAPRRPARIADRAERPHRRWASRWSTPASLGVGASALLLILGLVIASGDPARSVPGGVASPVTPALAKSAPPPTAIADDVTEPAPASSRPVIRPLPATADAIQEDGVSTPRSRPAPRKRARHLAGARARRERRDPASATVAVATHSWVEADDRGPRRLGRVASPPPSKAARRMRAFGHHYRRRGLRRPAAQAFRSYLRLAPGASDAREVRRLVTQLGG